MHVFKDGGQEQWETVNAVQTPMKVLLERQNLVDDDKGKMQSYLFIFYIFFRFCIQARRSS